VTVQDDHTRECSVIEVDTSLPGKRVVRVLDELESRRGLPEELLMDNGPEFIGGDTDRWAYKRGIKLRFIDPGKPIQNARKESFHGRFRDER
jgi:putative transposase